LFDLHYNQPVIDIICVCLYVCVSGSYR